jgi:hypothetical protein
MDKKGSHVGVVLSFVIFVTFIIFLYLVVQPTIELEDKKNFQEILEGEIIEKTSADLTSVSVVVEEEDKICVQLLDFFTKTEIGNRIIVKNEDGSVLSAIISDDDESLYVPKNSGDSFIKIHESNEFNPLGDGKIEDCEELKEDQYDLGLVKTNKQIFETKIIELINNYNTDYEALKEKLNVETGGEFGFSFTYNNGTIIGTKERDISISVYADNTPIQYISENADSNSGYLNVKVW